MTLKDVAVLANCSVATVSKALKNSPEISEEAKTRIVSIAKESGYLKKATTHQAVLGGLKTVIFNDVKGDGIDLISSLQKQALKSGFVLMYVSLPVADSKELMEQQGAYGLIIKGAVKKIDDAKIYYISDSIDDTNEFLKQISDYKPKRASRAGIKPKKAEASVKSETEYKVEKFTPPQKEKEEIWLL